MDICARMGDILYGWWPPLLVLLLEKIFSSRWDLREVREVYGSVRNWRAKLCHGKVLSLTPRRAQAVLDSSAHHGPSARLHYDLENPLLT